MGYKENKTAHRCLECGDNIDYGRSDKKFCSEQCKNNHNNKKARTSRLTKLKVLGALDKNYRILDSIIKLGFTSMDIMQIKQMGFDITYITSVRRIRNNDVYYCFDIEFKISPTKVWAIYRLPSVLSVNSKKRV